MDLLAQLLDPGLLIPIVAILMPMGIVALALGHAQRHQERKHQTVVNLLEKGLPVPRELLSSPRRAESPMMRALSLVGLGVGMTILLAAMFRLSYGVWACGMVPLAVGIAQLIAIKLEPRPAQRDLERDPEDVPSPIDHL